ncbi:MAG: ABC transporter permease, partial [Desulfamplus sp.]|nr:ABC transporter permease [Desulfamplus sp.]
MVPVYPQTVEIHIGFRELLHPMFQKLPDGIS